VLAKGTDLDLWAETLEARSQLPRLVRRLIYSTNGDVLENDFRADEGVGVPGWDGKVLAPSASEFVPEGDSRWELSTSDDLPGNATENYRKRSEEPLGANPAEATFLYVTPRRWGTKDDWISRRRAEGVWKDVRVYDADRLEAWLERAPVVHIWFSRLINLLPEGAKDLETYWTEWSQMTSPPLTPDLATAGRVEASEKLLAWASTAPELLTLRAETEKEAIAFVGAVIHSVEGDDREKLLARAVIVDTEAAWEHVVYGRALAVIIPQLPNRDSAPSAVRRGHHVLIPIGRDHPTDHRTQDLPPVSREAARIALQTMGFSETQAGELAELAWRGLQILQRKIAVSPALLTPRWAQSPTNRILVPAVLAGAWDEARPGDVSALEHLSRIKYEDLRRALLEIADQPDAPIRHIGTRWFAAARADSWSLLARSVEDQDLSRFHDLAVEVLRERDPKYELPIDQRFAAAVHGKVPEHSQELRKGIAETLGLMAALSGLTGQLSGEQCADWVVRDVFETTDWQLLASLTQQLSLLAEASPEEFMSALERDVNDHAAVFTELFREEKSLFAVEPGIGVLWGLETIAWSRDHLPRATMLLAAINELLEAP